MNSERKKEKHVVQSTACDFFLKKSAKNTWNLWNNTAVCVQQCAGHLCISCRVYEYALQNINKLCHAMSSVQYTWVAPGHCIFALWTAGMTTPYIRAAFGRRDKMVWRTSLLTTCLELISMRLSLIMNLFSEIFIESPLPVTTVLIPQVWGERPPTQIMTKLIKTSN